MLYLVMTHIGIQKTLQHTMSTVKENIGMIQFKQHTRRPTLKLDLARSGT